MTLDTKTPGYEGSVFSDVWNAVKANPYKEMPRQDISFWSTIAWFKNRALQAATRTLNTMADLLPPFRKLAHPNGICLKGVWEINKGSPYSGYFKEGSTACIIARASVAGGEPRYKDDRGKVTLRAFGLAGKLFPIASEDDKTPVKTANFFLIDDFGGTKAAHFTDVALTNAPKTSKTLEVLAHLPYAINLLLSFGRADKASSGYSNPTIRQVYQISELGESDPSSVVTPKWMQVSAAPGQTVDANDVRDELDIKKRGCSLVFNIAVTSKADGDGRPADFKQIGTITFNESVASETGDTELHFHHPKWRTDLNHG